MFYLHLSNRTENLIAQLAEVLHLDDGRDPFSPEYFLIQSQGMERMLSQSLAKRFVSWCNYEYMLPTRFFALMADRLKVESGHEEYARDKLCWYIESIFRGLGDENEIFATLTRYISDDSGGIKRYQLAQQLANIFDQYQIMRPGMIDGWESGKLSTDNPAEIYQMELWNLLSTLIGHSRHRGLFLRDLIEKLQLKNDYSLLIPKRLSVFGLHTLPPVLLNCLQAMAQHCEVHFYLLSPCEMFWGEQQSRRAELRKNISDLHHGKQPQESIETIHPLLNSLCQQGREFQDMLLDTIEFAGEYSSFADPFDPDHPSLLHRMQSDLLKGEMTKDRGSCNKDDSMLVVSAHSPYREIMILKDRVLSWLDQDPDLALKDIVVMAPDIQEYSSLISAIFHEIPHSIADKNPVLNNAFLAVFIQFLELCSGRFGWNEVLDLFERKEVYPRFDTHADELDLVRHWVASSGIRWGLSGSYKEDVGLPGGDECTWKNGLDRLLMGYATGREGDLNGILPYPDIEGSTASPLGGLSFFFDLLEQAACQFSKSRTLSVWAELLAGFAERLFVTTDNDGLAELHGILSDLGQEYGSLHQESVSFEVICSWLEGAAGDKRSSAGFLRGQLTFCSMLPMRSIPFEKVCILGLNDTVFPKNDFHPPFDLLGETFVPGDRSRRRDDRYQFLEAILSARGSLYLSYVGQSIRSNDVLPPSVVVSELLDVVKLYGIDELVDVHPLHGFSSSYFDGSGSLFSYDRQMRDVSSSLYSATEDQGPWWHGSVKEENDSVCSIAEFLSFFKNPQRYFVRNVLGIYPGTHNSNIDEHEPFVLDTLEKYLVEQDMADGGTRKVSLALLQQKIQTAGLWPLGAPGNIQFAEKLKELAPFSERVDAQRALGSEEDRFVEGEFYGLYLSGKISSLYTNGSFISRYARLKGQDVMNGWLHHCLCSILLDDPRETRLLSKDIELVFPAGSAETGDLQRLIALFQQGRQTPSRLLVEPAFAFAVQKTKTEKSGRGDPVAKAIQSVEKILSSGFDTEWELLYRGQELEEILDQEFLDLCDWFYESIWKRANVRDI